MQFTLTETTKTRRRRKEGVITRLEFSKNSNLSLNHRDLGSDFSSMAYRAMVLMVVVGFELAPCLGE